MELLSVEESSSGWLKHHRKQKKLERQILQINPQKVLVPEETAAPRQVNHNYKECLSGFSLPSPTLSHHGTEIGLRPGRVVKNIIVPWIPQPRLWNEPGLMIGLHHNEKTDQHSVPMKPFTHMKFLKKLFRNEPVPSQPLQSSQPPPRPPYDWSARPSPAGDNLEALLPAQVGMFVRVELRRPKDIHQEPIYARYRKDNSEVFVELGICADAGTARMALSTAKSELQAESGLTTSIYSERPDPGFLKCVGPRLGAFVAWTRGSYYFSVHAKDGETVLHDFVSQFPY